MQAEAWNFRIKISELKGIIQVIPRTVGWQFSKASGIDGITWTKGSAWNAVMGLWLCGSVCFSQTNKQTNTKTKNKNTVLGQSHQSSDFKPWSSSIPSFHRQKYQGLERLLTSPRPHNQLVTELDTTSFLSKYIRNYSVPGTTTCWTCMKNAMVHTGQKCPPFY